MNRYFLAACAVAGSCMAAHDRALADPVSDFYAGKTVRIINWAAAGGEYDIHGKLVSRHLGKHIPGKPTVLHQTMTGGGGIVAANYLYNVAPKDGTSMGIMVGTLSLFQAFGDKAIKFDAGKFNWIGTIASTKENIVAWHTAPVKTFEDLRSKPFITGASGRSSPSYMVPKLVNELLGAKIKIVTGFRGGSQINLAMERGEVQGRYNTWSSWKVTKPDWIKDKKITVLVQQALTKPSDLQGPPLLVDLAKTPDDKKIFELMAIGSEMGRPLAATPGIPAERVKALIEAYRAMTKDADFIAEAKKLNIEIDPVVGEDMRKLVQRALATPAPVVARMKKLLE
ncbi:MAG: Bug family tripartite tricarboxylate transporter substrate binding protein [Beijerinckiaceae bacterium]